VPPPLTPTLSPSKARGRGRFEHAVKIERVEKVITFAEAQARERALLESARDMAPDEMRWLIWRTEKAIVVPRGLPDRDDFAAAASTVEALGFAVFERDTGGDLTPQEPGVVNLSLVFRMDGENAAIKDAYLRLTAPVIAFLGARYALAARTAAIPGAFCDGAYNIACGGKKLAGTAQRWKLIGGEGPARRVAVLGHLALMVSMDLDPAIAALNAFYAAARLERKIIPGRHVTLSELFGQPLDAGAVAHSLAEFLERAAGGGPLPRRLQL